VAGRLYLNFGLALVQASAVTGIVVLDLFGSAGSVKYCSRSSR